MTWTRGDTNERETQARQKTENDKKTDYKMLWNEKLGYLKMRASNLDNVIEIEDNTDLKGEAACAGGACEII